jgi:hypothetical protein
MTKTFIDNPKLAVTFFYQLNLTIGCKSYWGSEHIHMVTPTKPFRYLSIPDSHEFIMENDYDNLKQGNNTKPPDLLGDYKGRQG